MLYVLAVLRDQVVGKPWPRYLAAQVLFALLVMHVQVLTRFVVASPMLYWIAARCVLVGQPRWLARGVVFYFLLWGALGCLLFCNFYPWT